MMLDGRSPGSWIIPMRIPSGPNTGQWCECDQSSVTVAGPRWSYTSFPILPGLPGTVNVKEEYALITLLLSIYNDASV